MRIDGERIYLRPLTTDDVSFEYVSWLNDPEVTEHLATQRATVGSVLAYVREKNADDDILFLGIFDKKDNEHIGNVKCEFIHLPEVELGILLGNKKYWGKGLGSETVDTITKFIFENYENSEKVYLKVYTNNKRAIKCYEKAGFKQVSFMERRK